MAIKHLAPKSKEEIIGILEDLLLNKKLLDVISKNDDAYQFVAWFISQGDSSAIEKITRLNGLCEIIREIKGGAKTY